MLNSRRPPFLTLVWIRSYYARVTPSPVFLGIIFVGAVVIPS